jgi:hypothetical protein
VFVAGYKNVVANFAHTLSKGKAATVSALFFDLLVVLRKRNVFGDHLDLPESAEIDGAHFLWY